MAKGNFLNRIDEICQSGVYGLILREKDTTDAEYEWLVRKVLPICERYDTRLILHEHVKVALRLKHPYLHVSMGTLSQMQGKERRAFWMLGASCHSREEVQKAVCFGATYVTLSPIFETACKPLADALGTKVLSDVAKNATIPVIALGGIRVNNVSQVKKSGAEGICVRGEYMTCKDVAWLTRRFTDQWREA